MASALTVLFLAFLWSSPSISVSPSRVIAPGAAVTLGCRCWCWGRRLFLYKDGIEICELDAAGDEFTIPSARWEDAGAYSCRSRALWEPPNWSYASDIVRIIVAEIYYPKPSISLHPSGGVTLGGAVTIRCRGRHQNMRFLLYKDGNPTALQDVEPAGDVTQFPIHDVSRRDAGSYSCCYRSKSDPPVWSYPSDPVELVVAELPPPGPSISVSPSGVIALGGAVTIHCQCWCEARRLFLYKDGIEIRELDAAGDGGEFTIPRARWEDAGFYSCRSRSRSEPPNWSDPSDYVRIVVAELSYPKPSISLHPSGGVALGGAVTIRCRGRHQNMRFLLHKDGNPTALQDVEPAGDVAEFPIRNVSRGDAGSYSCCYRSKSDPPVWSEPSDPLELLIAEGTTSAGPQEPRPPTTEPAGEGAWIWLYSEDNLPRERAASPRGAEMPPQIPLPPNTPASCILPPRLLPIRLLHPRMEAPFSLDLPRPAFPLYKSPELPVPLLCPPNLPTPGGCDTRASKCPLVVGSADEGSVELSTGVLVAALRGPPLPVMASALTILLLGQEFLKPTISVSPSRVVAFGGNLTIRCEGWQRSMEFVLCKAGHLKPQVRTVPDRKVAEFPIANVSREDGGRYTCHYRSITEQSRSSYPSDPAEIIVGEPSYPKPSISLSPSRGVSLGGAVAIWCRGQHQGVRFVLNKEGRHFPPVDSDGFGAVFPISNVRREDGGSYSCSYHSRSEPFAVSYPSDPVELVVRDTGSIHEEGTDPAQPGVAPAPTLPGSSGPGESKPLVLTWPIITGVSTAAAILLFVLVAFVCFRKTGATGIQTQHQQQRGPHRPPHPCCPVGVSGRALGPEDPNRLMGNSGLCPSAGKGAALRPSRQSGISPVDWRQGVMDTGREDTSSASCSWSQRVPYLGVSGVWLQGVGGSAEEPLAAPIMAFVLTILLLGCWLAGQSGVSRQLPVPRLSISVSPSRVIALGAAVTIRCQCRCETRRLFLYKDGIEIRELDAAGDGGEFTIPSARREDGGVYRCRSRFTSEPPSWSDPSDIVRIIVVELIYPKPSISLHPSGGGVALGGAVTVRCWGQHQNMRFLLYKDGNPTALQEVEPAGNLAEILIHNVSRRNAGSYRCCYHEKLYQFTWSYPSDPRELVVAAAPSGYPDFTYAIIAHLVLSAMVLFVLGLILSEAYYSRLRGAPRSLDPTIQRRATSPWGAEMPAQIPCPQTPLPQRILPPRVFPTQLLHPRIEPRSLAPWAPVAVAPARGSAPALGASGSPQSSPWWVSGSHSLPQLGWSLPGAVSGERGRCQPLEIEGGGIPVPGGAAKQGAFPRGHSPSRGTPRELGAQGLLSRPLPTPLETQYSVGSCSGEGPVPGLFCRPLPAWDLRLTACLLPTAEPSYPKPILAGIPSEGVSLGGSVSIQCEGQHKAVQFVLNKDGRQSQSVVSDLLARFQLSNVRREDGGSYNCSYHSRSEPLNASYPSDPVELVVRDPSLPRPNISLSPTGVVASGANVTIRCEGQRLDGRFFVHRAGDLNPQRHMDPAGAGAKFRIPSVGRQHGGSYSCSYRPPSEPFVSSQPSDPVQLVVAEPNYPKPNISGIPREGVSLGGSVSIWCKGQHKAMQFVLNKDGRQSQSLISDLFAVFPINNVSREDGGSYSCFYHRTSDPFNVSYPSDPVELVVRDPSLPRPSISLSPTWVTAPGADVTIRCEGQRRDVRFFLHKAGDLNLQRHMDPAGAGAEFRIPSVGRQHRGSYSCSYRPRAEPFVSSQPSDPVQLVVAEPSYPKPSISLSPSGGVSLGGAVAIWCHGLRQGMRFVLNKEGRHFPPVDSDGLEAEFPISNVSREDGGNYSCSYHSRSEPFAVSYPSDPVELVVREPSYPKPNISLSPSGGGVTPGGVVTIRCECRCPGARVLLSKAGDPDARHSMDPAGDVAEFPIRSVSLGDAGSYSCRYRTKWDQPVWSEPSDSVELMVTDAGSIPAGGTDPAHPAPTLPGSMRPGESERKLSSPIVAGVSVSAIGLLLLLLAFLCYRRIRGGKGPAPTQSRESEPATTVYALMGEGKQLDVLPQEPNPSAEGLTYAELDGRALQAKPGGPGPCPQDRPVRHHRCQLGAPRAVPLGCRGAPHPPA
ncbi:uncharacterized protein ACDP82_019765 [Pangshura tecta]